MAPSWTPSANSPETSIIRRLTAPTSTGTGCGGGRSRRRPGATGKVVGTKSKALPAVRRRTARTASMVLVRGRQPGGSMPKRLTVHSAAPSP